VSNPDARKSDEGQPPVSLWERIRYGRDGAPIVDRFRRAVLKPEALESSEPAQPVARSVEELEAAERYADDTERFFGLVAAPLAAAIGFFIPNYLIQHPPVTTQHGQLTPQHASVTEYHTLEIVLLVLAFGMLASAWYRKRLFLGILLALFGLGVFNLHYWGFGIPFLLLGSWLLVRAYRAHQAVREATGQGRGGRNGAGSQMRPRANKRYTPPA
jgi:hypothetical protein